MKQPRIADAVYWRNNNYECCPWVELTLDSISGCDYVCKVCWARQYDPCRKKNEDEL